VATERDIFSVGVEAEPAFIVQVDVVEHEHALGGDGRLVGGAHEQRTGEAELLLLVGVDVVRVVPE